MKYKNIIIVFTLFATLLTGCKRDEIFEREHYKQVIALKSEGTFKVFNQDFDLAAIDANGFIDGFISATIGGSLPTDKPVKLTIVEDADLFDEYNQFNFAQQTYAYAKYVPDNRKIINDYSINIPASERTGMMKIRIRPTGLSPDTVFMIPFRVSGVSEYEMNLEKSTVLFRVHLKNQWSSTRSIPQYNHRGLQTRIDVVNQAETNTVIQKHIHPVAGNAVRIFAGGSQVFDINSRNIEKDIAQWAVILTMDDDGNVIMTPWNTSPSGMKVKQIYQGCGHQYCRSCNPAAVAALDESEQSLITDCHFDSRFTNKYAVVDDGWGRLFKTFMLCYEYVNPSNGQKFFMKEELKIEYTPEVN